MAIRPSSDRTGQSAWSRQWWFAPFLPLVFVLLVCVANASAETVAVDGESMGRRFDGTGAVSGGGGTTRLLYDYPEPERSQILDYLFTPGYGASLQVLKVEIGADTNSTNGPEPSHMRTPYEVRCDLGYEWWLMKEAKARNPEIKLAALQWGAPGWLGDFWSVENIDYIMNWLACAEFHGLTIDYVGGWNERGYNAPWLIAFSRAVKEKYPNIQLIAADSNIDIWRIADDMAKSEELFEAVDIIGVHSPCGWRSEYRECSSADVAKALGKPLWTSEYSAQGHDVGAPPIARAMNRHYIDARITGNLNWSLVSSWYATYPIADTGLVLAQWPWSGHYRIGKSVWVHAHTAQFADVGWHYIDSASRRLGSGATVVGLMSPKRDKYSLIIETLDAVGNETVDFQLSGGLPIEPLYIWATNLLSDDPDKHFMKIGTVTPDREGRFSLALEPGHVYSVTNTTGQGKGSSRPSSGPAEQMPLPYYEDFEGYPEATIVPYFADVNGAFETAPCADGREGTCYRQVITTAPIGWDHSGSAMPFVSMMGDPRWWGDYRVGVDVFLEEPGYVELLARVSSVTAARWTAKSSIISGYRFRLDHLGNWRLYSQDVVGADVVLAAGVVSAGLGSWHRLELAMRGTEIRAFLDGVEVAKVHDDRHTTGQAGIGVDALTSAQFDNFSIEATGPWPSLVPNSDVRATASSEHDHIHMGYVFHAANAVDDRPETAWHTRFGPTPGPHWITLELDGEYEVMGLTYQPKLIDAWDANINGNITEYRISVSDDGTTFQPVAAGVWRPGMATKIAAWPAQKARFVRLEAVQGAAGHAAAGEIRLIHAGGEDEDVWTPFDYRTFWINSPIRDARVDGVQPIEIVGADVPFDKVTVAIGDEVIYQGTELPKGLAIDGSRMADGLYSLAVTGTTDEGGTFTEKTQFVVENVRIESPEDRSTIQGSYPVAVTVTAAPDVISAVRYSMTPVVSGQPDVAAETIVYSGSEAPETFYLDTLELEEGAYDFAVTVEGADGVLSRATRRVVVHNWEYLTDELLPPQNLGWLGIREALKSVDRSAGWQHEVEEAERFFGDASRLKPVAGSAQHITWQLSSVHSFVITVYGREAALPLELGVAVSADGLAWRDVAYDSRAFEPSAGGWYRHELTREGLDDGIWNFLRITVEDGAELQLGEVRLKGRAGW